MVQLSTTEISAIDNVVRSIRDTAHRKILAAKKRTAQEREKQETLRRRRSRYVERFTQIINQAGTGYRNLLTVLRTPKLQELFAHVESFQLYLAGDESTEVTVTVRGQNIELSIIGSRVSSCQAAGKRTRYTDCSTTRLYCISDDVAPEAFLSSVSTEDYECDWLDWIQDIQDEEYAENILRTVTSYTLASFFSFDSLSISSMTKKIIEENREAVEDGYDTERAWQELAVSPGIVLVRFFYDCANSTMLEQHLSEALRDLQV